MSASIGNLIYFYKIKIEEVVDEFRTQVDLGLAIAILIKFV
jgi:hypothetical protein